MKNALAILVISASLTGPAGAAGYSLDTSLGPAAQHAVNFVSRGSFTDHLSFDVTSPYDMGSGVVEDSSLSKSNSILLEKRHLQVAPPIGEKDNGSLAYVGPRGDNFLEVTATDKSGFNNAYIYAANAVSVSIPEPGEWALTFFSIGLIGAVIRRHS